MACRIPSDDAAPLQVLNIAGNQLSGNIRVQGVPKLRALIANDNAITAVKGVQRLSAVPSWATVPCCATSDIAVP